MGRLIDSDKVYSKIYSSGYLTDQVEKAIDNTETAFDLGMVLEQLEDYGKYKGILRCEGESFDNYIPVSVAKQIVRARGLGRVLGYLEESNE